MRKGSAEAPMTATEAGRNNRDSEEVSMCMRSLYNVNSYHKTFARP